MDQSCCRKALDSLNKMSATLRSRDIRDALRKSKEQPNDAKSSVVFKKKTKAE